MIAELRKRPLGFACGMSSSVNKSQYGLNNRTRLECLLSIGHRQSSYCLVLILTRSRSVIIRLLNRLGFQFFRILKRSHASQQLFSGIGWPSPMRKQRRFAVPCRCRNQDELIVLDNFLNWLVSCSRRITCWCCGGICSLVCSRRVSIIELRTNLYVAEKSRQLFVSGFFAQGDSPSHPSRFKLQKNASTTIVGEK